MEDLKTRGGGVLQGRYELGRVLGQGTFAKVYMAKNLKTGQSVAMKVVAKEKVVKVAGMCEQVKREIAVMKAVSHCRHPNIVGLHEVLASRSKIYFAMELVRGGELFSTIARRGRLGDGAARRYFRQLVSAVDFCHSRGVFHRDLKPENLLLDGAGNLKVADFGLSAFADHARADGLLHTACGTPAYAAPEVIARRGYDGAKADVWSCGVILFVLLAGFLPFQDKNVVGLYKKIQRGDFKCPSWFSSDARRLVVRLLDPNPGTRITIAKLVESSWFKKGGSVISTVLSPPPSSLLKEPASLNAFHIISLFQKFDLSSLFEDKEREEEGMRFATREPASGVVSRLEGAAAKAGRFKVTESSPEGVRMEGEERGRKGKLAVAANIFRVAAEVLVVDVKKDGGDSLEYQRFCREELRPALKDIVWAASNDSQATAA